MYNKEILGTVYKLVEDTYGYGFMYNDIWKATARPVAAAVNIQNDMIRFKLREDVFN